MVVCFAGDALQEDKQDEEAAFVAVLGFPCMPSRGIDEFGLRID